MFWLIETEDQLQKFINKGYKEAFVELILSCHKLHPTHNDVSLIYVKPKDEKGYIFSINHSEAFSLELEKVLNIIKKIDKIIVRDPKEFYYFANHPHLTPSHPYILEYTKTHGFIYNRNRDINNLNRIVPIVKHYEWCEQVAENIKENTINPKFVLKKNKVFWGIEVNGIKIDTTLYSQYFKEINDSYVYTRYNLNTTTTRPSNNFDGVNYAALDKKNGERQSFIPRNDYFLDMDISAYHPTLLGKLLDYEFTQGDIHQEFAEMYGVDYKKAKELTFKQMYGGVFKQYRDLEFFKRMKVYTDELWEDFNKNGYIETPISKHRFYKSELDDMNPQKLLNYVLQNLETTYNVFILYEILKILRNKKTKIVLYVYDSFLLDVDETEKDTLVEIVKIFDKYNLKLKYKKGETYNF